MARPLRLELAGALYHVTSRGDRREAIFEDNADREQFLSVLADVVVGSMWSEPLISVYSRINCSDSFKFQLFDSRAFDLRGIGASSSHPTSQLEYSPEVWRVEKVFLPYGNWRNTRETKPTPSRRARNSASKAAS